MLCLVHLGGGVTFGEQGGGLERGGPRGSVVIMNLIRMTQVECVKLENREQLGSFEGNTNLTKKGKTLIKRASSLTGVDGA